MPKWQRKRRERQALERTVQASAIPRLSLFPWCTEDRVASTAGEVANLITLLTPLCGLVQYAK
jgi:hypothetical protein